MINLINIVIPVYNEAENIKDTLSEIENKIKTSHNIYFIYDFDKDNTIPVIKDFIQSRKKSNFYFVKNKYGHGVLNAIKTGFENIVDGVILVVMADLSDDLDKVDEMFTKINEGYDIVCGSRYMRNGKQIGGPRLKKSLSRLAGVSLHYLIGIPTHDISNSFKMYTKNVINDIEIESNGGFELAMEIVVKAFLKGYKITEVPTVWRDRQAGESRFKFGKWLPKYFYWYLFALKGKIINSFMRNAS